MRPAAGLAVGLALAACVDEAPPVDGGPMDAGACGVAPSLLMIGTGTDSSTRTYRALADGDPVVLVPGPQGGQHIWLGVRGRGFDPSLPRFEMRAYRPSDGALIGRLRIRLPMGPAPEDPTLYALPAQTLVMDDAAYCSVLGSDVRIEMEFNDLMGRCATVRRTVRLTEIDPATPEAVREAWIRCCTERRPRCYPGLDASVPVDAPAAVD